MVDRGELVEAALDGYPEGVALLDGEERAVFWNQAAETLTGFIAADVLGRALPDSLKGLIADTGPDLAETPGHCPRPGEGTLIHLRHKAGHDVPVVARRRILRDGLGKRIGTAAAFYAGEHLNALPHGETSEDVTIRQSQQEMESRLELEFEAFVQGGEPLGVLWIAVDQALEMRTTHGARACEAMLESVERTLANGLRPEEEIARWGSGEFLVLVRDSSEAKLSAHGRVLAGLARTANFMWWGDRLTLTVSAGAAEAQPGQSLKDLLERAQASMYASLHAGGNRVTLDAGRCACSPS